jgi:hypothetical protein
VSADEAPAMIGELSFHGYYFIPFHAKIHK